MKIYAPALALGLSLLCNISPYSLSTTEIAFAADSPAPAETAAAAPATAKTAIDPKADAILHKVSDFYSGLKVFHTTLVREDQKGGPGHSVKYKIEAEKPTKLSIEISGSSEGFHGGVAKMNGEKLSLYNPTLGYVTSKAPSNYEDLVRDREFQFCMAHVMHGQNLLDALLTENPYQFLMQHYALDSGSVAGEEKVDGENTDHLVLKSGRMTYDVWVENGSHPWVRKVSSERSSDHGQGHQIISHYEKWSDSAKAASSDFVFSPPAEAKEIPTFFTADKAQPQNEKPQPQAEKPSTEGGPRGLINKEAPPITLDTMGGGKLDLASLKSKNVVVLDFWATWCPPCRAALPILAEVTSSYEAKGVKFFAIDLKEDPSKISAFLEKQGLKVNVALDKDGKAAKMYGVEGIPQSVIIGKDGVVRVVHEGFSSDLKTKLTAELDEILSGKAQ
jgi:thiol-disulfide isomerase/thioredoxin